MALLVMCGPLHAHSTLPGAAFVTRPRLAAGLHAAPQRREVDHTTERSTALCCRTRRRAQLCPWLPRGPQGASIPPSGKQGHVSPLSGAGRDARSPGERASSTPQGHRNRGVLTEGGHGCHQGKLRPGPPGSEKTREARGLSWTHPPRCSLSRGEKIYSFNI